MPANCDISPNVHDAPAGAPPFQEQKVKHGCLLCPLRLSHPLSFHEAAAPGPAPKDKSKGNSSSQHFGQILLVRNSTEKKLLCVPRGRMFIAKAWLWVQEAVRKSRSTDLCEVTTFDAIHLTVACSGGGRERWLRGESQMPIQHQIPYRCVWTWAVNEGYLTWN